MNRAADGPLHVFVCWPNNSGSTLVEAILAGAANVATLPTEGQFIEGFDELGPIPMKLGAAMLFTEVAGVLADPGAYDWVGIRRLWIDEWDRRAPDSPIRLEKSTPNVCRLAMLGEAFGRVGVVLGWRDPYAQSEGILRARRGNDPARVAEHVVACLRWQLTNLEWIRVNAVPHVAMSYESLTADPNVFCEQANAALGIEAVVPDELTVKTRTGPVTDMNAAQIGGLTPEQLGLLTEVFAKHAELLATFGYELR